jgi:hypothetical protein
MSGERVVSYETFTSLLAHAKANKLCNAPDPAQIDGLMEGVGVVLAVEEFGCNFSKFQNPYHHRVRATILFEYKTYLVDILDRHWHTLPTVEQWQQSLPVITIPAETYDELVEELEAEETHKQKVADAAERVVKTSKGLLERLAAHDQREDPEDGGAGVREPVPSPGPAPDAHQAQADLPSGAPVG